MASAEAETDTDTPDLVWVGSGEKTGICHILVRDIAFRPLHPTSVENLSEILKEEFGSDNIRVLYSTNWPNMVIQVSMAADMKKIKEFVEESVSLYDRILNANDMNRMYETEMPAHLAAPGTVCCRSGVRGAESSDASS